MADDLDAFYAEIAAAEAEVAQQADAGAPTDATAAEPAAPPPAEPSGDAAPPPLAPPPSGPPGFASPELPPPTRPPPVAATLAARSVISSAPVIAAPPQPGSYDDDDEPGPSVPAGPAKPPPPAPFRPPPPAAPLAPPGKQIGVMRQAAGERWVDPTLTEWPENDYRIFVGNLAPEVTDAMLEQMFGQYESFQKARVVRHNKTNKSKGFGFVSYGDARFGAQALKEMHGQYIASRPCQLKKNKDERTVKDRKGRAVKRTINAPPPGGAKRHHMGGPPQGGGRGNEGLFHR